MGFEPVTFQVPEFWFLDSDVYLPATCSYMY